MFVVISGFRVFGLFNAFVLGCLFDLIVLVVLIDWFLGCVVGVSRVDCCYCCGYGLVNVLLVAYCWCVVFGVVVLMMGFGVIVAVAFRLITLIVLL